MTAAAGARRRGLLVGGVLFVAASVASLGALEVLVRILAPQTLRRDEGLVVADPARSFRLTPGFRGAEVSHEFNVPVEINSRGLRDREVTIPKPPGVWRVLVLGDSFTYGSGVPAEATYPKRLEALLGADDRRPSVEVVNAGVSGYGTFHEAEFLRQEGWAYEPDFVVLQVFAGNDLSENLYPFARDVRGGFLRFKDGGGAGWAALDTAKEFLRQHSHAYRFVGDRWHLLRIRLGREPFYAASVAVYRTRSSPEVVRGWATTARYLADIAEMTRRRGVGLLVLHVPKNVVLDAGLQAEFARFHQLDPADLDWELPARRFAAIAAEVGVSFLDLTEPFRATGRPLDFYYPHNGHWNARGHDLVARSIAAWLDRHGRRLVGAERRHPSAAR